MSSSPSNAPSRSRWVLASGAAAPIALQVQRARRAAAPDVLYVHGSTFGVDLSVFHPFESGSWADALTRAGWNAWGFDFVGFGALARYPASVERPAGSIDEAMRDLQRAVQAIRQRNPLSAWAQYRRFIEDVPRGQPQVLAEAHMHAWAGQFLASDPASGTRVPPAVMVPSGPLADVAALWNGCALYDPATIESPTLLVRGEWDSLCTDGDAGRLMSALRTPVRQDVKVPRATHLMHLEQQRFELYATVNNFLQEVLA